MYKHSHWKFSAVLKDNGFQAWVLKVYHEISMDKYSEVRDVVV
jgi:hypothetical protein